MLSIVSNPSRLQWLLVFPLAVAAGALIAIRPERNAIELCLVLAGVVLFTLFVALGGTRLIAVSSLALGCLALAMTSVRVTSSIAVSDVFFVVAFVFGAPRLATTEFWKELRGNQSAYLLLKGSSCLVIGGAIASLAASNPFLSFMTLFKLSIASVALPLLFSSLSLTSRELNLLVWSWVVSVGLSAGYALFEAPNRYNGRVEGLAGHPNSLALTCVLASGPCFSLFGNSRGLTRLLTIAIALIITLGMLPSGSRAGVIGYTVSLICYFALSRNYRNALAVVGVGSALMLLLLTQHVPGVRTNAIDRIIETRSTQGAQDTGASDQGRSALLRATIDEFKSRPLIGSGLIAARAAHNVYLQVLAATGLIGFIGFGTVVRASLVDAVLYWRRKTQTFDREMMRLVIGLSAGYCGLLAADFFQNAMWERFMWVTPCLIVASTPLALHGATKPNDELVQRLPVKFEPFPSMSRQRV